MSNGRKSFLLHFDSLGILDQLTDEQCGKLLLACRDFNLGKELKLDATLELVFFPFKSQFIRDQEKYQLVQERNKINGSKGGRPKNPDKPKEPSGLIGNPDEPRKADSDSVNGSDSVNDLKDFVASAPVDRKRSQPVPYQQIVDSYNDHLGNDFGRVIKTDSDVKKKIIKKFWELMSKDLNKAQHYFYFFSYHVTDHQKGKNDRGWKADFEFICRPTTVDKYLDAMEAE